MTSGLSATGKEGYSDDLGHELRLGCQDTTLAWGDIQRVCESQPSLYFGKCTSHIGSWNSDSVERIHRALLGSRMEVFKHFEVSKASPQKWLLFQLYCAQTENIDHFANIYRLLRHMQPDRVQLREMFSLQEPVAVCLDEAQCDLDVGPLVFSRSLLLQEMLSNIC